mgnify:CR=1 FL=1
MKEERKISNARTERKRAVIHSYQEDNEQLARYNKSFGWPSVTDETTEADIKEMGGNLDEMKAIVKSKISAEGKNKLLESLKRSGK